MIPSSQCQNHHMHPIISSAVADYTNSLLWGDHTAILVRGVDWYDNNTIQQAKLNDIPAYQTMDTPLLPASLIHASLRTPNVIYPGARRACAGLVVGSKLDINNNSNSSTIETVNVSVCYPTDAGSYQRNALNRGGKGCNKNQGLSGVCLNNSCLTTFHENCKCNNDQVPPENVGKFYSSWIKWIGGKQRGLNRYTCWYETFHDDTVTASNSLWLFRQNWSTHGQSPIDYQGWNECPCTCNVRKVGLLDAVLIQLPLAPHHNASLCDYSEHVQQDVLVALQQFHAFGYTSQLPILFLEQAEGLWSDEECRRLWNGTDCDNGYRKHVFAQEFIFSDGSCLVRPEECSNVYYFAFDHYTGKCNISSASCRDWERNWNSGGGIHTEAIPFVDAVSSYGRLLALQGETATSITLYPSTTSVLAVTTISMVVVATLILRLRQRARTRRIS